MKAFATVSICFSAAILLHAAEAASTLLRPNTEQASDPKTVQEKCQCEEKEKGQDPRPLMVFPLLKELKAGWSNTEYPPLLDKKAGGTGSLIVDVGLDKGLEFFKAIENGFEVVGFEPNPISFRLLAKRCRALALTKCYVYEDVTTVPQPLRREPGASYLIRAAVGAESGELDLLLHGAISTFQAPHTTVNSNMWQKVPIVKIDDFIQENVYLFKIDTQGHDPFVLTGASNLFKNHVVRQLIWEVDPLILTRSKVSMADTMTMLQDYGMLCFTNQDEHQKSCKRGFFSGDTVNQLETQFFGADNVDEKVNENRLYAKCWMDFLCINIEKSYPGANLNYA